MKCAKIGPDHVQNGSMIGQKNPPSIKAKNAFSISKRPQISAPICNQGKLPSKLILTLFQRPIRGYKVNCNGVPR